MSLNDGKPPASNRGAENTYESGLVALVDWFQLTLKIEEGFQKLLDFFSCLDGAFFIPVNGQYGYKQCVWCNGIFIFFDGHEDMGIHLQLTGQGCRYLETMDNFSWVEFFNYVHNLGNYNITRLDIALDDFVKHFTLEQVVKKIKRAEIQSRFKKCRRIETIDLQTGDSEGNTLYFGQPTSRVQIRFYEKNHERRAKGYEHNIDFWNRYELQLRKERAKAMFDIILCKNDNRFANEVKGVLKHYIRFLNRGKDSNKSRWDTWGKWDKFIGSVETIKLTVSEVEKDLMDSHNWVSDSVSATIAMLDYAGLDINYYKDIGYSKLKEKHLMMINKYNASLQKKELTIDKMSIQ